MHKLAAALLLTTALHAQQRTVHDTQDHLTFQIPSTWSLATHDRELSTFHHEARTAPASTRLHYVAAIAENPYPASNFSGAHFYVSVTPAQTADQCSAQATKAPKDEPHHYLPIAVPLNTSIASIDGHPVAHGHDDSGRVCTEYRDEIYTTRVRNTCLRFDLAMNNFCGGEVSGVRDMTPAEIVDMRTRLEAILQSVKFDR
ncbi:hypothetical protein SAMN05421771_3462 [Granulicella pectinivorans]|uniref:Uncharacterized protein n=1 Tax=Granulicella pectinivorans TaxID=474950 RepID=A0A1I6MSC3_9BACT|nr:hypothetical protein [Granulicella pectinivorans]SFS18428.1 hypothetical protein SAMN05421771_3462 [Granulicella pectinivorans]